MAGHDGRGYGRPVRHDITYDIAIREGELASVWTLVEGEWLDAGRMIGTLSRAGIRRQAVWIDNAPGAERLVVRFEAESTTAIERLLEAPSGGLEAWIAERLLGGARTVAGALAVVTGRPALEWTAA